MFLHRVKSTYGRLIPKPKNKEEEVEEIRDEAIPIQDQIEALRTKIQLKKRYNKVLKDELEESRLGASSILEDLTHETMDLRQQLVDAMNSEKAAVQKALRTQREFQLAMTDRAPAIAIPWLDDKLFDLSKELNIYLNRFMEKHKALEEAEGIVLQIEKWPRPGTLPWEVDAISDFHRIENLIENMKVNLETANILHTNYHDIKMILREERGKYTPTLRALEEQIVTLRSERGTLQKMLDDAVYFRDEAQKNLIETEKEASENRKKRRKQMNKMKKAVQKVLEANQARPTGQQAAAAAAAAGDQSSTRRNFLDNKKDENAAKLEFLESLRVKRMEVEQYEDRARRLVDTMRVPDLICIPNRFHNVMALGARLETELETKEQLRDLLLRHRDQLYLISCYFNYTGHEREIEYNQSVKTAQTTIQQSTQLAQEIITQLNNFGDIIIRLRLIAIAILDRLDEGKRRHQLKQFPETLKMVSSRIYRLKGQVKGLEELFGGQAAVRNYSQFVKRSVVPGRLIRIGSPAQSDESDVEEEYLDMKIPTREDIKAQSLRTIHQGILKKGYR